jgi:glycosyltransferase involved in cell wall biosynthesis
MYRISLSGTRVLISGHLPPPVGGIGSYYQALLGSSLKEQVDLYFVLTSSQKRKLSKSGEASFGNAMLSVLDCWRFAKAALRHRPQISHIATAFGLSFFKHSLCVLFSRFLGSRVLLHPHCSMSVLYTTRSGLWRWYFRLIVRCTEGVLALSHEWLQLKSFIPECPVYHLPNAIDFRPFRHIAPERFVRNEKDLSLRVLYLGYLGRAKGSFDLIEAAQIIRSRGMNLHFDLVGDELSPGEMKQLSQLIDNAQLDNLVRIHPAASGPAKMAFFRAADMFAYPSHHEGMPMAVIEAMASGLPIVATRVGGLPDLVADGVNGILVDPQSPEKFASALCELYFNEPLRLSMQEKSYHLASEHYDIEKRVPQLVTVYKKVLNCREV